MQGGLRPDTGLGRPGQGGGGIDKFPGKGGGKFPDNKFPGGKGDKFPGGKGDGKFAGNFPNRPAGGDNRPFPDRRPNRDRPVNIGNEINNNINNRPQWANIDNNRLNNVQGNWNSAIRNRGNFNNWLDNHPNRGEYWNGWGDNVRDHWNDYHQHDGWFNQDWWEDHQHACCGWHYNNDWYDNDWSYWWSAPAWVRYRAGLPGRPRRRLSGRSRFTTTTARAAT